jgi:hypothetical protein
MATNLSQTGLEVDKVEHGDIPTGATNKVLLYASGSGSDTKLYVKSGANTQQQLGFDIDQLSEFDSTAIAQGDMFAFSDAGVEKKIDFSNLEDAIFANMNSNSSDVAVAAGGAITLANNSVGVAEVATAVAGDGLTGGGGSALAVQVSGAVLIASDKVGLTGSIAGNGLNYAGGVNSISSLKLDISEYSDVAVASGDKFLMLDSDGSTHQLESVDDVATFMASGANNGLAASSGVLSVGVDDSTIELNSDALRVMADGINSSHIALGALDAEHYSSGSIQNGHLAGSIANAKLANSGVTLTQGAGMAALGAVSLGGSITVAVDGVLEDLDTLGAASSDGEFIVATGAGAFAYESGNTARTSLGLGTGNSPTFSNLTLSGWLSGSGAAQLAGNVLTSGGFAASGSSSLAGVAATGITLAGDMSGSGALQMDGGLIIGGTSSAFSGSVIFGPGGYDGSGATITSAGAISGKGNLTVAGTAQFAGGYGNGDGGVDITSVGGLSMDGNLAVDGNATFGTAGASGNSVKFHGDSSNEFMQYDADKLAFTTDNGSSNAIEIGTTTANGFAIEVANLAGDAGKIKATAFVTYSDESLKEEVTAMDNALDAVMSLNGVEFTWKGSGERDFGFLAQEVKNVIPQAVSVGNDGIHGVDYSRLTSVLVEAVKAQQVQIEELKTLLKK